MTNKTKTLPLTSNLSIEQIFDYCDINVQGIDKEELVLLVVRRIDEQYQKGYDFGLEVGEEIGYGKGYNEGHIKGYSDCESENNL